MLYSRELKRVVCSKIFLIFFIAEFFFAFYSQMWSDMALDNNNYDPPVPGGDYGMVIVDDPVALTENATASLLNDFVNNRYTTYPYGFVHVVHLKGSDKDKLSLIISRITGFDDPENYVKNNFPLKESWGGVDDIFSVYEIPELNVLDHVTVDEFRALMTETDNILGGGSQYSPEEIDGNFSLAPMSYEEALAEYNSLINDDRITNGYARLFCDYHGLFTAFLPVFLIVVYLSADKRSKMEPLIFSRSVSSAKIVLTRFAALVTAGMLPVLFTAVLANIRVIQFYGSEGIDHLAMFKYSFIWLLPTVIAVTGVDMLLMGLIHPIAVVILHFAYWFSSTFLSSLGEKFGIFDLIIRHNTVYDRQGFIDSLPTFTANRLFFTALGLVCAAVSVFVWKLRREGKFGGLSLRDKLSAR